MARALANPVYLASPEKGVDGRSIISGARAPLMTDGRIGDFWLDTRANEQRLYGPKNAAEWPDLGLIKGNRGWTPVFAVVADGTRRVQQVVDWQGGEGIKPATGKYIGATGLVDDIADAIDIRGDEGPQALINALAPKTTPVTYETLTALAEGATDNEQAPVKRFFEAGGVMPFRSRAEAQTAAIPAAVKALDTQAYAPLYSDTATLVGGAKYRRVNSEPTHGLKLRSADRWTAEGNSDSANGGWWEIDEPVVTAAMAGVRDNTLADGDKMVSFLDYCRKTGSTGVVNRRCYITAGAISLVSGERLSLRGDGPLASIQCVPGGTGHLIAGTGGCEVSIEGVQLKSNGTGCVVSLSSVADANDGWALELDGNIIDGSSSATLDVVSAVGYRKRLTVRGNDIYGSASPVTNVVHYTTQCLLRAWDAGVETGTEALNIIEGNSFFDGAVAVDIAGTTSLTTSALNSNRFYRQHMKAIRAYHGDRLSMTGNIIDGCLGKLGAGENNIGGAVWLDCFSKNGEIGSNIYSNNIIRYCTGVGLFVDEGVRGELSGWTVIGTKKRADPWTDWEGLQQYGGHGIVLVGGTEDLTVRCHVEQSEGAQVVLNRMIGVDSHTSDRLQTITFDACNIVRGKEHGILINDQVRAVAIIGGSLKDNGQSSSNSFDAVHITRGSGSSQGLGMLTMLGVNTYNADLPATVRSVVNKTYTGGFIFVSDTVFDCVTSYVIVNGVVGYIRGGRFVGTKTVDITGASFRLSEIIGFPTSARIVGTSDGSSFVTYTNTTLGMGNANQQLPVAFGLVAPAGSGNVKAALIILSTSVQVRLTDTSNAYVAGNFYLDVKSALAP